MTRAHVTALALVNWKGVFYERYRLDRHVTALEGANGAGKTTVMIAAYVVLLPDMSRLRFTNVAETGASGADRGIYGRLGEAGGPSYAVLDVQLADDRRILAGVRLERGSEPTVEATPFMIEGLAADTALSELLLVRTLQTDQIAELDDIKAAVRRAGGSIEVFRSIKDYFAALFERGVTPLRLANDEERSKWSEMLRTSMTGGISRALTSDLRSFLLKEETGLGDVLGRMRSNLESCRRTRSEVAESRVMERDITGVFEAGQAMFSCAQHAVRLAAEEGQAELARARAQLEQATRHTGTLLQEVDALSARETAVADRLTAARQTQVTAQAELDRMHAAQRLERSLREQDDELAGLMQLADAERASQVAATLERVARREQRSQMQGAYQRAALGLAHLQQGLDELHRRAHAHRQLGQRLAEARTLLDRPQLSADDAPAELARLQAERTTALTERARHERARDSASCRVDERARAQGALAQLEAAIAMVGGDEPELQATDALSRARRVLARLAEHDGELRRSSGLEQDRIELERRVTRQRVTRQRAEALGLEIGVDALVAFERKIVAVEEAVRAADGEVRAAEQQVQDARAARLAAHEARSTLEQRTERWGVLRAALTRVSEAHSSAVEDSAARAKQEAREAEAAAEALKRGASVPDVGDSALSRQPVSVDAHDDVDDDDHEQERDVEGGAELDAELVSDTTLLPRGPDLHSQQGVADDSESEPAAAMELAGSQPDHALDAEPSPPREAKPRRRRARKAAVAAPPKPLLPALRSAEDLVQVRDALNQESIALATARGERLAERESCLRIAAELDGPGAALDPELVRLRDELGAELLLSRFDDVKQDEAAALEARLGPLVHALVVPDPLAAAEALLDRPRALETVWLVRAGTDLEPSLLQTGREDVMVREHFGARVSRKPAQPSVGAGARAARAEALRARAEALGGELEQLALSGRQLASLRRDLDAIAARAELWIAGDPVPLMAASLRACEMAEEAEREAERSRDRSRARRSELGLELAALQPLRAEAALLEPPDHSVRLAALEAQLNALQSRERALAPLTAARTLLGELVEVLREPSGPEGAADDSVERIARLTAALERGYRAAAALDDVLTHRHASGWQDAAELLESQAALVPSLEAQHDRAREALEEADRAVLAADASWEQATARSQEAEGRRGALAAQRDRIASELAALGGNPSESRIASATGDLTAAAARAEELEADARGLVGELARQRERAESASRHEIAIRSALREAERKAEPAVAAWTEARAAAEAARLVPSAVLEQTSRNELAAEATSRRALLVERIARSRGGEQLARQVADDSASVLATWQLTRDWLRQRIPLQISRDDDPLLALEGLRDHLDVLEGRLERQETDLRGASEDVARGIDVQVRRARGQVRRLNVHLAGVRFGSIAGIRVEMRRVERMEQILKALRDGDAQELLFLPSIPIEEALEEIFRRYGGGRGGGQRLLDYREYVELVVEVQRQSGETWEPASPSRLSTGETIGVGAALMMVVLTEWERDSNLLRARSHPGSLRFLFLDEANRLSRDNLGVLFELCRALDLQLLIAAPEVARAEGNTTYRLIRRISESGAEEVLVTGRRAIKDGEAELAADEPLDAPASPELSPELSS